MTNCADQHDHLLHTIRAAHPGRDIRIEPLPPEALADLPDGLEPDDLAELVISSTGPGHYAISLPSLDDPAPEFRLFFVNVNDMPGDGELLGTFRSASAAVATAIGHETGSGSPVAVLDHPLTYADYEEHIKPIPLENWSAGKVSALLDQLRHSYPALSIDGASAPMLDHSGTHCGSITLTNPNDAHTTYTINLQQIPGPGGPGYAIGVHWTDPASGQPDGFIVDPRCPNLTDAVHAISAYETTDTMQSWFDLRVVLQERQVAREAASLSALDHPAQGSPTSSAKVQTSLPTHVSDPGLDR